MSQEKVDKYKKDKANRKKLIAKQKRQEFLEKTVVTLIGLALVAFIVISAYFKWFHKEKATVAEAATYSLSEEEISSVWEAYENPTEPETTSGNEESEGESLEDASETAPSEEVSTDEVSDSNAEEAGTEEAVEEESGDEESDNKESDSEDDENDKNEDNDEE